EARLKRSIRRHLAVLGFDKREDGSLAPRDTAKQTIRTLHEPQRLERLRKNRAFISTHFPSAKSCFASGRDVSPPSIKLRLQRVHPGTWESNLFRLACLTWSVPVSGGYGRRLRYLVWDSANKKLAGVIGLGDPVFNLAVRDRYIGWSSSDRAD